MMNVHMPAIEKRVIPEIDRRLKKEPRPLTAHETIVDARRRDGRAPRPRARAAAGHGRRPHAHDLPRRQARRRRRRGAPGRGRASRRATASSSPRRASPTGRSRTSASCAPERPRSRSTPRSTRAAGRRSSPRARRASSSGTRACPPASEVASSHPSLLTLDLLSLTALPLPAQPGELPLVASGGHRPAGRRREPALHERHDGAPEGRHADARELHVARRGARAHLPALARRRGAERPAAAPHLRVHVRAPPAALARGARGLRERAHGRQHRRGPAGRAGHGDGRRPRALAAARAAHPAAGRGPGPARARGVRRRGRGEPLARRRTWGSTPAASSSGPCTGSSAAT